jgi:hypothetical protein
MYQCGKAKLCLSVKANATPKFLLSFHPQLTPTHALSHFSSCQNETNTDDVKGNEENVLKKEKREREADDARDTKRRIETTVTNASHKQITPSASEHTRKRKRKRKKQTNKQTEERDSQTDRHFIILRTTRICWAGIEPPPPATSTRATHRIRIRISSSISFPNRSNPYLIHFLHDSRLLIFSGWHIVYFCVGRGSR